jgi:hypothetical protein
VTIGQKFDAQFRDGRVGFLTHRICIYQGELEMRVKGGEDLPKFQTINLSLASY